nr:hypothetical protein [Tanacetum cinerariifolium]
MKFLRSLPSEWNTHVVVWRNKVDLNTMSIYDIYNNFKIVEQEVKRTIASSASLEYKNMAFVSSPGNTNEVDTANIQVSIVSTPVSTVSSHDNTANLSDATMYAFLANQPNGSQLMHEDLEQIHEDDLKEIDLKWQLALLSMKARRECKSPRNQESRPRNQDSSRKTVNVEDTSSKAMVSIDGAGFDWIYMADDEVPTNMDLMAFLDSEEFQHPEGYRPKDSKSVCLDTSNEINKAPDASIVEDWVSDSDEDESEETGALQDALKDQGYFDSGYFRHMTGNISYLTDFKEHDGWYVVFRGGAKGGKITGKGTIRTDLFGPSSMSSIMHKKYYLVITDDFSRFTWVFFLATKDKTSRILKRFITEIKNLVEKKVKIIRCDNGTEFMNRVMNEFCEENGIKRAEAVNTACYVQNRVLVVKPNFKTLYELFKDRSTALSFMRPFGCHVIIINTLDQLGKFDGKSDEGIFVGYSTISKAFRVYNIRTIHVKENLHITFLENKPMIAGGRPEWLFDIDALSKLMIYAPVPAGTHFNNFTDKGASFDAVNLA